MKYNTKRTNCDSEKLKQFFDRAVPKSLKIPTFGKYIVYTAKPDEWSYYSSAGSMAWISNISNSNSISQEEIEQFASTVHMISDVTLSHPRPRCTLIDNVKSIKVLVGDSCRELEHGDLNDWLYCSVSEKLKDKNIALTGTASMYPKNSYEHLIQLSGGTYDYKINSKTNLVINCTPCLTKSLAYAKKHNIKIISEAEFFKFLE